MVEMGWPQGDFDDESELSDGTHLQAPPFLIPEEEREYIPTNTPGLTLWTRKPE
jgi:hypothetical protein